MADAEAEARPCGCEPAGQAPSVAHGGEALRRVLGRAERAGLRALRVCAAPFYLHACTSISLAIVSDIHAYVYRIYGRWRLRWLFK